MASIKRPTGPSLDKKPAAMDVSRTCTPQAGMKFVTPVMKCQVISCGCSLRGPVETVDAWLVSFSGIETVAHQVKRCSDRTCGASYNYNFRWEESKKVNTVTLDQISALFITAKLAFTKDFVAFMEATTFRGFLSPRAAIWAWHKVLYTEGEAKDRLDRDLNDAKALYLAMREFSMMPNSTAPLDRML